MAVEILRMTPLIEVFDMSRSVTFYRDVLGLEVVSTSPPRGVDDYDWALLRHQGAELMLNTAYEHESRPPEPESSRLAGHRDMTFFFGCPDIDAAYEDLAAKGVSVTPPVVTHYGMKQIHFRDPDGYGICLQWQAS